MKSTVKPIAKGLGVIGCCVCLFTVSSGLNAGHISYNNESGSFEVLNKGNIYPVQKAFLDKDIRNADPSLVMEAQKKGLISLTASEMKEGQTPEFRINSHGTGKGGGPFAAIAGYWVTKLTGYGIVSAGMRQAARDLAPEEGGQARDIYDRGVQIADSVLTADHVGGQNVPAVGLVSNTVLNAGYGRAATAATLTSLTVLGTVPVEATAVKVSTALLFVPWLP